jgi:hypothetical protein
MVRLFFGKSVEKQTVRPEKVPGHDVSILACYVAEQIEYMARLGLRQFRQK